MIIDLTHTIKPDMPMYPGSPAPVMTTTATLLRNGYHETLMQLSSHAGTHMDAPSHLLQNGFSLDVVPVSQFYGRAAVLDVSELGEGGVITEKFLRARNEDLLSADFVLFYTGWEKKWDSPDYFGKFPVPDTDAARYLVSCGLKGIGTDALSVDPLDSRDLPVHRVLLGGGLVIVECLCLRKIIGREDVMFFSLPLKFGEADGAPVRAVAEFRDFTEPDGDEGEAE
ncbi:MAG: cyclase family protein [Oscillibacter sp.]|nr:cyclase family protein [Oscillibacter sp.]